jgi:FkbM family methyltransferase
MPYYSQIEQDRILQEKFFFRQETGFFVDVGAEDGRSGSNSLFFEEKGWKGICIEPHPESFAKLSQTRKCLCLPVAVGSTKGTVQFTKINGYGNALSGISSTYDPRHLERIERELAQGGGTKEEIEVPCETLQNIFHREGVKEVHYLSIDTEGSELNVLKGIDFDQTFIHIIDVENNYPDTFGELRKFLFYKGFTKSFSIQFDEVFINSKSKFARLPPGLVKPKKE